jgi:adenylosuccinate synthase
LEQQHQIVGAGETDSDLVVEVRESRKRTVLPGRIAGRSLKFAVQQKDMGLDFERPGIDVIYDGLWGSCGKGKICSWLSSEAGTRFGIPYRLSVTIASPNSGHTAFTSTGKKLVLRQIPVAGGTPGIRCLLGAGSLIEVNALLDEAKQLGLGPDQLGIDVAAGIVEKRHCAAEKAKGLVERIGSTGHGAGAARAERLLRDLEFKLASQIPELQPYLTNVAAEIDAAIRQGKAVLLEGGQGTMLSHLATGPDNSPVYPYCTSRVATVSGFLADALLSPRHVRNPIGVIRTYPHSRGRQFRTVLCARALLARSCEAGWF